MSWVFAGQAAEPCACWSSLAVLGCYRATLDAERRKEVPKAVSGHPRVFATLTAPGFGLVHTRRVRDGLVLACRPRRVGDCCPHVAPAGCRERHSADDPRLGEPLGMRCYDCAAAVLWHAFAGRLWHRFGLELRREVTRRAGLSRTEFGEVARLSYAKVAEYKRRGPPLSWRDPSVDVLLKICQVHRRPGAGDERPDHAGARGGGRHPH